MKCYSIIFIILLIIISSCDNSSDNKIINPGTQVQSDEILPLEIGNSWIYQSVKWRTDTTFTKWEITENKTMPLVFPDSSETLKSIYLCKVTEKYNTYPKSYYIGFIKESDGVILVDLNEDITKTLYYVKVKKDAQIGWIDSLAPGFGYLGKEKVQTPAGIFDSQKYYGGTEFISYYCIGVGLVANINYNTDITLFSYDLKK